MRGNFPGVASRLVLIATEFNVREGYFSTTSLVDMPDL